MTDSPGDLVPFLIDSLRAHHEDHLAPPARLRMNGRTRDRLLEALGVARADHDPGVVETFAGVALVVDGCLPDDFVIVDPLPAELASWRPFDYQWIPSRRP